MSRTGEGGDLFAGAAGSAREIAGLLDDGDQAFLVTAGRPARAVLADGTFSPDALVEAVDEIEAGVAATDYSRAIALASELLAGSRNLNRELYVLGDMQRSGWENDLAEPAAPAGDGRRTAAEEHGSDGVRAYVLPLAGPTMNLGISSVSVERKYGGAPGLSSVSALVSNHGRRDGEVLVRLFIDGAQVGQAGVTVPSGGSTTARFAVTAAESEWHDGRVELPPDALDSDNRRYFVIPAARLTEVLVVRPDESTGLDEADYLERALDPDGVGRQVLRLRCPAGRVVATGERQVPVGRAGGRRTNGRRRGQLAAAARRRRWRAPCRARQPHGRSLLERGAAAGVRRS